MFDKLIQYFNTKLKTDSKFWRVLAYIGLAIIAGLLLLKYKLFQDQLNSIKVAKSLQQEKTKDAQLHKDLNALNSKESKIDHSIAASDRTLVELKKDHEQDLQRHVKATKTIDSITSWEDVDKVVKKQ